MGIGAKNKGYIKNKSTGEVKKFLYNPSGISDSKAVTFSEINAPGSSHPKFQYVNTGARTLTLELFLSDSPLGTTRDYLKFLEQFMPKGERFNKPPVLVFAMGNDVRECIVSQLDRTLTDFDENLNVTRATVSLSLIQLG